MALGRVIGCDAPAGLHAEDRRGVSYRFTPSHSRRRNAKALRIRGDRNRGARVRRRSPSRPTPTPWVAAQPRKGKGQAKPVPVARASTSASGDTDRPDARHRPSRVYAIGAEGLVTYPKHFPTCTFSQATSTDRLRGVQEGEDRRRSRAGAGRRGERPDSLREQPATATEAEATTTSAGQGATAAWPSGSTPIRPPRRPASRTIGCPRPASAIMAKFVKIKIGGLAVVRAALHGAD